IRVGQIRNRISAGLIISVAANYAFGPLEDDFIIKHRLLTRTTTTRGEPPLKKLQKKFTSLFVKLDKNEDNFADCDKLAKAFLQELNTFEIPLLKSKAVVDANRREKHNFDELREEINRQIKEIAALDAENTASSRTLELRKKQFALLLHVWCNFRVYFALLMEEKEQKNGMEDAAGGSEPMHVD
ncbi:THO complex subunit 7A-like, partial [Pyrus ussuriensis x Pyrus communis]